MHKDDIYGFGNRLTLEAFDMGAIDMMAAEGRSSIEDLISAANSMESLAEGIVTDGVSRQDAITMESIAPSILPYTAPVNSFTLYPTATNLQVALEAIDGWRNLNITNLLKAVYKFLSDIINWIVTQFKKLFGQTSGEGPRVLDNIQATADAVGTIMSQTQNKVDMGTEKQYEKALEKAKLTISDAFNHLTRRLVMEAGTVTALNALRSQLHTAYAKLDTVTTKFTAALDACHSESRYEEAAAMFSDLAALNPETLINVSELAMVVDVTRQVPKLSGTKQITALRDLCKKLTGKSSSWDVKNSDTVQAIGSLVGRLQQLIEVLDDPLIGDEIPEVHDFTSKSRGAPEKIAQPLMNASRSISDAFVVTQDCVAIFIMLYSEVMSLTQATWDASKGLMGAVATSAKQNKEVKDLVERIETTLKSTLKKA